ncbi:growth arrest-specific protein 1 [Rhinophrynus dorsalis]
MAGGSLLCVLLLVSLLGLSLGRRLICWQAMMQCQDEPECNYAFSQYTEACSTVLHRQVEVASSQSSARRRCPSHCIAALIQLNNTKRGPALEDCDCVMDDMCKATKRAIEPCLPRTSSDLGGGVARGGAAMDDGGGRIGGGSSAVGGAVMGCMEARRLCQSDMRCSTSLHSYLSHCGRLFNGVRCTDECKAVIEDMMQVPKALLLNDCVCDGTERPICESVKENMARLCFGEEMGNVGPGSSGGSDYDYDDDYEDEPDGSKGGGSYEDEQQQYKGKQHPSQADNSSMGVHSAAGVRTVLASIVLMLLFL